MYYGRLKDRGGQGKGLTPKWGGVGNSTMPRALYMTYMNNGLDNT